MATQTTATTTPTQTAETETTVLPLAPGLRQFAASYPGTCAGCGQRFPARTEIAWSRADGSYHLECAPRVTPPTPEELAQKAEEEARHLAWKTAMEAVWAEEQKAAAKANRARRREERKAEAERRMAELVVYAGVYDNRNSYLCDRCGGTGRMPFAAWNGVCLKCQGACYILRAMVPQPRVKVDAEQPAEAKVGDVLRYGGTLYRVTRITWRQPSGRFMASIENQRLHLERLVDGDRKVCIRRTVHQVPEEPSAWSITTDADGNEVRVPAATDVKVSAAMKGQPAEQDADGRWITY